VVKGRKRCRMHGGAHGSGAPSGERNGNFRHGFYTAEAIAERKATRAGSDPYGVESLLESDTPSQVRFAPPICRMSLGQSLASPELIPEEGSPPGSDIA
jgi:hypothetical protein